MTTITIDLPEETKLQIENIKNELKELKEKFKPKEPQLYYSRKEVAKLFGVNISTIHNWSKKGIIQPLGIGSRVYFERSAVEQALVKLKN
ncbi:helix-turn-helix domain-containing protein [Arenibacter lacus]|uniref:helix-turn-helix domain-containing protein n=1 Tax=Arenibacter lacus TaxID=2608629 RepID=UPI00123D5684|nr:helix-turn-helix domain-containing protein [Arenibacter lacus]